jgi:hypothetical protein
VRFAGKLERHFMGAATRSSIALAITITCSLLTWAQDSGPRYEVGIVYYASGAAFKPLDKDTMTQGGRSNYSAKVKGEHALVRLPADQPQVFRVCGVDPSRFKLFRFKSEKNARTVTIAKNNMWIGGSKVVLMESEVPVAIQNSDSGCYALTPRNALGDGEFGFSPVDSLDAFMFGVGDPKQSK